MSAKKPMSMEDIQKALASLETPVFGWSHEAADKSFMSTVIPKQDWYDKRKLVRECCQRGYLHTLKALEPSHEEMTGFADESLCHAVMSGHAHVALWLLDQGVPWEVASPVQDPEKGLKLCETVDAKVLAEWGVALWKENNPEGFRLLISRWERDHLVERVQSAEIVKNNPRSAAL